MNSPWDGAPLPAVVCDRPADASAAVGAVSAHAASWLAADRPAALLRLDAALARRRTAMHDLLVREAGKTAADARMELDAVGRKIAVTLEDASARIQQSAPAAGPGTLWRPRGVAAILGPYNFPVHLLHGLVAPALAVGCTVVAKPSERTPLLAACYREAVAEAGLSDVCRVVIGGREAGAAITAHPGVATIAAVGGAALGRSLAALAAQRPELVLALELGGVNPALVLGDADREAAAAAVAEGAWRMAGQRCNGTRQVHVPRTDLAWWRTRLQRERLRWLPGRDPGAAAGPMIDVAARAAFQQPWRSLPDGLALVAGDPQGPGGAYADPLLAEVADPAARSHPLISEEVFGPALVLDAYDDADEAVARLAANPWRLSCAVWTADRDRFLALAPRLPYGLLGHNRSTAGALPTLPFGGVGRSGNGRPAAIAAARIFADETAIW